MEKTKFELFFNRLRESTSITNQLALAATLEINRSAVTQAKKRDVIPQKWVLSLSRKFNLAPDWLEFGHEPKYLYIGKKQEKANKESLENELSPFFIRLPKMSDSLEKKQMPKASKTEFRTFDAAWIKAFGNINDMILMDVTDNSMSPTISYGDTVMIDRSPIKELKQEHIYAVQYNNLFTIKRVSSFSDGFCLTCDNPDYKAIIIQDAAKKYLSIIGRVVWLCRTC